MVKYRIGIISDTHGLLRQEVLERLQTCDYIIHGGDITGLDILERLKAIAPVFVVRGNNDMEEWTEILEEEIYFEIGGIHFYMIHNIKSAPKKPPSVDVIIYGHSHKYYCKEKSGVLWLNPGSCGRKRFNLPVSMVMMEIDDGKYKTWRIDIV
jgi:putative phosphoesterase